MLVFLVGGSAAAAGMDGQPLATLKKYCFQCHAKAAMGGVNLEQLSGNTTMGEQFQQWEKVVTVLEQKRMPPAKMPQPEEAARQETARWVRARLGEYARQHEGDPGRVTVRRLTSGEYAYTIRDLTRIDLKVEGDIAGDSVGGEGFTNFGDVQFMEDARLERYLELAKKVAAHAVIGSGPLEFSEDGGKTGFELSAIRRIQAIYKKHGFRAASGEGGKPFGLEKYSKAFYACWRYQHRAALGEPGITMEELAQRQNLTPVFVRHIWTVLQSGASSYPSAEVIARWKRLPGPGEREKVRAECDEIQRYVVGWPRWLFGAGAEAEGGQGDERALVLTDASVNVTQKQRLRFAWRNRREKLARLYLWTASLNPNSAKKPEVVWRNATIRFLGKDRAAGMGQPLETVVDPAMARQLGLAGGEFRATADATIPLEIALPANASALEIQVEVALSGGTGDEVVRCTISEFPELGKGLPVSALLGTAGSAGFNKWKAGVMEFAANLPNASHGEPTPSDKDEIPAPYNNTYNQPERDRFHTTLKYYRNDRFLMEKVLDPVSRTRVDQAWTDLLGSFEYHSMFLRFLAEKFKFAIGQKSIGELTDADVEGYPAEARTYVQAARKEFHAIQKSKQAAQAGHVEDCLRLARRAWRRPLTEDEKRRLRGFYAAMGADHDKAIRLLVARILVAPAFLYRLEQASAQQGNRPVSGSELASRLSYFLWSSLPDEELDRAAAAGELGTEQGLRRQVQRMLRDDKARRLSAEFFGQWLGFYRFDQFKGVDTGRFPEFTEDVKEGMHEEAVSFFAHIIRKDRPVHEVLSADYTFLNKALAKHYGVDKGITTDESQLMEGAGSFQRGGLLRLGAVLTVTSAPLRTSPVKRGDWLLRRVLGTPTPPPPADAGSIPADDKLFAGQTVRQRLEAHKRNPTCAACHTRIDPLGFPLERYDPVGRWRDQYQDGKAIDDSAELGEGRTVAGVSGLMAYLQTQERQILRTLSQKLLGYALGRTMLASDQPLIEKLTAEGGEARFSKIVTGIVLSRQFRNRRQQEGIPGPIAQGLKVKEARQ